MSTRSRTVLSRAAVAARGAALRTSEGGAGDRGSYTVEFTILIPIVIMLIFLGPQLGTYYFAREAAQAAANAGARAASALNAAPGTGQQAAETYMDSTASGSVSSVSVTESSTATTVTVTVTAQLPRIIPLPGLDFTVSVSSTRDRERFTTPGTG